jgi:DNA polymerase elongation subunit (family B)
MPATVEEIRDYLEGYDEQKYIVGIESSYRENKVHLIIHDPVNGKSIEKHNLKPFLWMKTPDMSKFYGGDRRELKKKMRECKIKIIPLSTENEEGVSISRLEGGYKYLVQTRGTYGDLLSFFKDGGMGVYDEEHRDNFLAISPNEQFLIQTGKRLFKGMKEYDDVHRLSFDLETTGLDPHINRIFQIGVKDNKGFQHVLSIDGNDEDGLDGRESEAIITFFKIINHLKPAIISGYNSENFDWYFFVIRCQKLGINIERVAKTLGKIPFYRKKQTLKMGPEMEYYEQTHMWGYNIMDVYHAVRRAQAINSSIKEAGLKYITKYSKVAKSNRVYIQGDKLGKIYGDTENDYWLDDSNGEWGKVVDDIIPENTIKVKGCDIVERYLIDDLWETEKVDDIFNQATFLLSKVLPTSFMRSSTMGTAATWKLLMLGWYYRSGIAIPHTMPSKGFIGGLSRLLEVGFSQNVVKFDFASLYPSIQLTHNVFTDCDVMGAMRGLLQYNYDYRNLYKELKKKYEVEGDLEKSSYYDKKQLPLKILNNGMFGSISAPNVYPWGDSDMGEKITCTGRQYLRHMIRFFNSKGFRPLVGDSVTYDTPIYVRYKTDKQYIDILPICDLFNESSEFLDNDKLRDFEEKQFEVLTRNGWKEIKYVYRHETNKNIHRITTKDRLLNVTEDHSLFQNGIEVKPSSLKRTDKIDIYELPLNNDSTTEINEEVAFLYGFFLGDGSSLCSSRKQKYKSRKTGTVKYNKGKRGDWKISNSRKELLEKLQQILKNEFSVEGVIKDHTKSSEVYNLVVHNITFTKTFCENFYTSYREKKIPYFILNSTKEIKMSFINGVFNSDGYGDSIETCSDIGMKSQVAMAGISLLLQELDIEYKIKTRKDKQNFINFNLKNGNRNNSSFTNKTKKKSDEVWKNEIIINKDKNNYVYDISTEDGTFVCGIGGIIAHNTDGFNFSVPNDVDRYVYTSNGNHHFNKLGKTYKGMSAVVSEYNDKYMKGVMGLDVDEICSATINIARKNYADLIDGEVKLVGNSIKSKKMPTYISEFIDKGIRLLLDGDGYSFVNEYYETVEMIYNQEIPLSKIANKARVRISVEDYKKKMNTTNKSGGAMAKQAHMELIISEGLNVDLGDTIYYVNTGTKKSHGDVQKKTNMYPKYTTKNRQMQMSFDGKLTNDTILNEEIILNCRLISNNLIENDPNATGEYNVDKYLDAFNKRIKPLLVCFNPLVRDNIIIDNPSKRKYFTKQELELTSGYPFKDGDQDKLDELLTITDEELSFWNRIGVSPTYMFEEYGIEDEFSYDIKSKRSIS